MRTEILRKLLAVAVLVLLLACKAEPEEGLITVNALPLTGYNPAKKASVVHLLVSDQIEVKDQNRRWTTPKQCNFFVISNPVNEGFLKKGGLFCYDSEGRELLQAEVKVFIEATAEQINAHQTIKATFQGVEDLRVPNLRRSNDE